MGQRLFLTYCAQCHGSDAGGTTGYPNLRDRDWLYGGSAEQMRTSITEGRNGQMPPFASVLGSDEIKDVAHHVMGLSGLTNDPLRAARGKEKSQTLCAACHGSDGKGNVALGAPNLTDGTWLYGGAEPLIIETITMGRSGKMPSHKEILGEGKIHLLAAYVFSLSNQ